MKTFPQHLQRKMRDQDFRAIYQEERELLEIALKIARTREQLGLSQQELAHKAQVTQQQLSKIENGVNCNMTTFLRVCQALGIKLDLAQAT